MQACNKYTLPFDVGSYRNTYVYSYRQFCELAFNLNKCFFSSQEQNNIILLIYYCYINMPDIALRYP